jgi:hypothetical protein
VGSKIRPRALSINDFVSNAPAAAFRVQFHYARRHLARWRVPLRWDELRQPRRGDSDRALNDHFYISHATTSVTSRKKRWTTLRALSASDAWIRRGRSLRRLDQQQSMRAACVGPQLNSAQASAGPVKVDRKSRNATIQSIGVSRSRLLSEADVRASAVPASAGLPAGNDRRTTTPRG